MKERKVFRCFDCTKENMTRFQALLHAIYATLTQKMELHQFGKERRAGIERRALSREFTIESELRRFDFVGDDVQ